MGNFLYSTPTASADALTTELNTLADGVISAQNQGVLDNTTNRHPFANFYLEIDAADIDLSGEDNPAAEVYLIPVHDDGTNYADTSPQHLKAVLGFPEADNQLYAVAVNVPIGPFKYAVALGNQTGQPFPTSGNTLAYSTHTGGTA